LLDSKLGIIFVIDNTFKSLHSIYDRVEPSV
jgi:hypothetical protein